MPRATSKPVQKRSSTGIVDGPGQANIDPNRLVEGSTFEFRTELFNALNRPQFSSPDTNFTSPTFDVISSTAVNPRVLQFAPKNLVLIHISSDECRRHLVAQSCEDARCNFRGADIPV